MFFKQPSHCTEAFHKRVRLNGAGQHGNGNQLEKVGPAFSRSSFVPLDKVGDNSSYLFVIRIDFDAVMQIILVTRAAISTNV